MINDKVTFYKVIQKREKVKIWETNVNVLRFKKALNLKCKNEGIEFNFHDLIEKSYGYGKNDLDLVVGDIYGGDCKGLNLPKDLIAGFFTKIPEKVSIESFTKTWLMMLSCNIAQMLSLLSNLH